MSRDSSRRRIWVVGLALAVAMVPALAFAAHPEGDFEDVPEDHTFHDDIQWMHDNGITRGCNPPENDEYCPDRELIRAEEAAFFHRYDAFLRDSLEPRLVPATCEEGQIAEFDGTGWVCADQAPLEPPADGLSLAAGDPVAIAAGDTQDVVATCAEGDTAVGGTVSPLTTDIALNSVDLADGTMTASVTNNSSAEVAVTGFAICAAAETPPTTTTTTAP